MDNISTAVFIDTSFFKAIVDLKDEFHDQAQRILKKLEEENASLATSNYILDESFTLIRIRCGIEVVNQFRRDLAASTANLKIIRVTVSDEANAWKWFLTEWSGLSFTDCVSFALMSRLHFKRAATFDKHFSKAGFQIES